jgi:signal transduction histidine kinase
VTRAVLKRLFAGGIKRRYLLLALLLSIALVVLGYAITATRRADARNLAEAVRERQDLIRLLDEATYGVMDAESAQRGFLLTDDEQYLPPLESGLAQTTQRLDVLRERYRRMDPGQLSVLDGVATNLAIKSAEMRHSVALLKADKLQAALAVVRSDLGLQQMKAIRDALESLRAHERASVLAGLDEWKRATRVNTIINTGNLVFTIGILLALGLLVTRDIRRRESYARDLATQIEARTFEIRDLSRHMSRVAESEKSALSRELHDELGGLLVAMRMDLTQLRRQLGATSDPALQARWERIDEALRQGIELKRRVIEDLRPTLLDNMGLFSALRWLATERCEQAQLGLQMHGLDADIDIPPDTALAVFRTVQEAIANVIQHAGASRLELQAAVNGRLRLEIADDGCGMPADADHVGAHGLKQMHFRMEAVGGELQITERAPHGTAIVLSVPLPQPAACGG